MGETKRDPKSVDVKACTPEKAETVIDVSSSPEEQKQENDEEGTPARPILCVKRKMDLRPFEEKEDCFILDFDPSDDSVNELSANVNDASELSVIAERGQVACRDYPHSRHLCLKFPFETTSHDSYCNLCYCYVCDSVAPCKWWTEPEPGHCHASEDIDDWKSKRRSNRKQYSSSRSYP